MKPVSLAGALLLAGLLPAVAVAQPDVEQVWRGVKAPNAVPTGNHVVLNQQDLTNKKVDQLLPPNALLNFDWNSEMLIAVVDRNYANGGHGIRVTKVEEKQTLVILPVPGPSPSPYYEATVTRIGPGPVDRVTHAPTRPFQVVKVKKTPGVSRVSFVEVSTDRVKFAFADISRRMTSKPAASFNTPGDRKFWNDIQIHNDGRVRITRGTNMPGAVRPPPIDGMASDIELAELASAITVAEFHNVPRDMGGPGFAPGETLFTFRVIGTPEGDRKVQGIRGNEGQHRARLDRVHKAMDKIEDRISQNPSSRAFDSIALRTQRPLAGGPSGQFLLSAEVKILTSGRVTVTKTHPLALAGPSTSLIAPISGDATAAEMNQLRDLIRDARLAEVDEQLNVPIPMHMLARPFTLEAKSPEAINQRTISGMEGAYGKWDSRLRPLINHIQAIGRRIESGSTGNQVFNRINRKIDYVVQRKREIVDIDADGNVTVSRPAMPPAMGFPQPISGKATKAEMRRLRRAVRRSRFASIPAKLPKPIHFLPGNEFTLAVDSPVSTLHHTVEGELGYYSVHESKIKPIMDVIDAIRDRIAPENPVGGNEAKGIVEVRGWWGFRSVWLKEGPNMEYEVKPWSFARTLIKFEGKQVKVGGQVTSTGTSSAEIEADELISPVKEDLRGYVRMQNGKPVINTGFFFPNPIPLPGPVPMPGPGPSHTSLVPQRTVQTFGSAARILTRAVGLRVTVDAWVFKDGYNRPYEALVNGVKAKVLENSRLTSWGQNVNRVRKGEEVLATRLSSSGNHTKVQPNSGKAGYLATDKLELGERMFHILPATTPNPNGTTGLTGAVNSTND